jgi:hypothetical protein
MDVLRIKLNDDINKCTRQMNKCEKIINENKRKRDDIEKDFIKLTLEKTENQLKKKVTWICPHFQELPDEMILLIIEFMPINSICKFNSTCKKFQSTGKEIKKKLLKKVFEKMDFVVHDNRKYFPFDEFPLLFLIVPSENDILKQLNHFVEIIKEKRVIALSGVIHYFSDDEVNLSNDNWIIYRFPNRCKYDILDLFNKYLKKQNIFELFGEVK